mmetsp:Transcript_328/g.1205  ORF Transcript_328/g.1205 Transcript_328/m.1205 type:complete len:209 (-) Transcript_328:484-1110(-)
MPRNAPAASRALTLHAATTPTEVAAHAPTTNGATPTPLSADALMHKPTAAMDVGKTTLDAKSPVALWKRFHRASSRTDSVASPSERSAAIATNAIKNPGTSAGRFAAAPAPASALLNAYARYGIANARVRFLVNFVTVAALNAISSSNASRNVIPAPTTCAVSCTLSPKNTPAGTPPSGNNRFAAHGYASIPSVPYAATFATATPISR